MLHRPTPPAKLGDRFVKAGDPTGKIWEVVRLWTATDGILHARLTDASGRGGQMTIASSVLSDPRFWLPAPAPALPPLSATEPA